MESAEQRNGNFSREEFWQLAGEDRCRVCARAVCRGRATVKPVGVAV